jgi:hypothetical protein
MKRICLCFSSLRVTSVLVPALLLGVVVTVHSPVRAQDGAAAQPMDNGQKLNNYIDKQLTPRVPRDFEGALASVGAFYNATPDLDRHNKVHLVARAAHQLYFATPENKRAGVVAPILQMLDNSLQAAQAPDYSAPGFPGFQSWEIRELANQKVQILMAEKRLDDTAKTLDQIWPWVINSSDGIQNWAKYWIDVHNAQGQPQKAVDGLIQTFQQRALLRDSAPIDVSIALSNELLKQGKDAQALSWAKLTFIICDYKEGAIRDATNVVTRGLTGGELSFAKANVFAQAQTNTSAPNPLDAVPLPPMDTKAIKAQLADSSVKLSPVVRETALILLGDYRGAMLVARDELLADLGNQDKALQVARVFKAKDADLARANAFLAYYQTGEGDNPIPAFLKETETAVPAVN